MNTDFSSTFTIMPKHCNYMFPMVFGGAFFSEMDLCAACCVNRLLHDSECDSAVTHKFSGTFHKPTECGDIIFLNAIVMQLGKKSVSVHVNAFVEKRAIKGKSFVAEADFVFVTKKDGEYCNHGLVLE